jgi:small GTP-binding protein
MKSVSKKIVLLGNEGVGKTSLVKRYVNSMFSDEYLTTIGIKISKKTVQIGEIEMNLMLWDIAGNMMNKTLYNNYIQGAHGVFLIVDAMRPETYESIMIEKEQLLSVDFKNTSTCIIINKSDLIPELGDDYLKDFNYDFLTSAKSGDNVEFAFQKMAEQILTTSNL